MTTPFSSPARNIALAQLAEQPLDVLVVGGGIVGSGIARDAAMRGLRVGLVDQQDFAAGTSSRSSRLLHGGLRYLEQGRVGLVHEASVEKKIVQKIAPHLAEPLGFVFPSYLGEGRPMWQLRIGVKLYDLLCGGRNFQPSRGFSRTETQQLLPGLKPEKLAGAVRYFDALTNDARLVIDTLRSAENHRATVVNYTRFADATRLGGEWMVQLEDCLVERKFDVRARTIVNATGPWADKLPHSAVKLRLSKGIHVIIDRKRLPVPSAVVITEGKRILFVLPWGERVIIGTTDTDYRAAPEDVSVDTSDIAYVLRTVNEFFPGAALDKTDILASYAGVRPLIANPDGSPSDISRAHQIRTPEPAWWDVSGGKLTTYRLMAEQTVNEVVRHLRRPAPPCRTADEPLLRPERVTPFSAIVSPPYSPGAVDHYVKAEWAVHLEDVMLRRSGWHYYHANPESLARPVAARMAELLGWTSAQQRQELAAYEAGISWNAKRTCIPLPRNTHEPAA